jgi:alkylated DNA repair protein alkB homolog 6
VATLSLGSHVVFNYHRYSEEQDTSPELSLAGARASSGRSVDPRPLLSLLLEPRSLVITAKELYTQHLHGIEPLEQDVLAPHNSHLEDSSGCDDRHDQHAIQVANWRMLRCDKEMLAACNGGVLERKTWISLTCREVENVLGGKGLGSLFRKQ